jgi:hypothetical protein
LLDVVEAKLQKAQQEDQPAIEILEGAVKALR